MCWSNTLLHFLTKKTKVSRSGSSWSVQLPQQVFTLCRFFSLGGRLSRIIFMALSGGSLKYGGSPSTISITMMPRDQISTCRHVDGGEKRHIRSRKMVKGSWSSPKSFTVEPRKKLRHRLFGFTRLAWRALTSRWMLYNSPSCNALICRHEGAMTYASMDGLAHVC